MEFAINLRELISLHKRKKFSLSPLTRYAAATDIPEGDVVVCSDSHLAKYTIGKVMTAGATVQLPQDHADGTEAELFVAEYDKIRPVQPDPGLCVFLCCFLHFVCML